MPDCDEHQQGPGCKFCRLAEAERLLDEWRHEVRAMLRLTDAFLRPWPGAACETEVGSVSPGPRSLCYRCSCAPGCNCECHAKETPPASVGDEVSGRLAGSVSGGVQDHSEPPRSDNSTADRAREPDSAAALDVVPSCDTNGDAKESRERVEGPSRVAVSADDAPEPTIIGPSNPDEYGCIYDAAAAARNAARRDLTEKTSAGDDFDLESAKALAFVEAPDSPSKEETSRLAEQLLAACDALDAQERYAANTHALNEQLLDARDREIERLKHNHHVVWEDREKLRAEVKHLEQLVHDAASDGACVEALRDHLATKQNAERLGQIVEELREKLTAAENRGDLFEAAQSRAIKRAEHAEHVAKVCADERDDLQQQLDEMQRNGIPDEWSSKIARERDEHAKRNSELEQNEVDRMQHVTDLIRQRDELKESCATWKEGYSNRRQERDDLQRQLDRAITIREEARDLQVQAEGDLDAANAKVVGAAAFIREHELGNEYWCWHHAAEALAKGETRKRAEMLQTKTPLCEEDHCRPSVETSEERDGG